MIIQVAICEDNKNDLAVLKKYIAEIMEEQAVAYYLAEFDSGKELLEADIMFHIVFLDIEMGDINGIETGRRIYRKNNSVKIIYQTSFASYVKEAVNTSHAYAYLEKPVSKQLIREQLLEFLENEQKHVDFAIDFEKVKFQKDGKTAEKQVLSMPVRKILYFEYLKRQREVKIVTEEGEYVYMDSISRLEQKMKPLGFEVCCRGILVNLDQIENLRRNTISLSNGSTVSLSQRRAVEFKERMNEYLHKS